MTVDQDTAIRRMQAVLAAAGKACAGDPAEVLGTLIGAIATYCAQRRGASELLAIAIDSLTRAKVEIDTGAPRHTTTRPS